MLSEYGGCLPLEKIYKSNIPFRDLNKVEMNSGRSCILTALRMMGIETIYIPHYLCPTVYEFLNSSKIMVKEYHIDNNFLPIEVKLKSDEMILWTNYYGCMHDEILEVVLEKYNHNQLIIDNTQAFFEEPVLDSWNVYSCRKFIGVPEGAYLVSNIIDDGIMEYEYSTCSWEYLEGASVFGSNHAYKKYNENEKQFVLPKRMSVLVSEYLKSIDYELLQKKRNENFEILHRYLGNYNELDVDFSSKTSICYPFLYCNNMNLRKILLDNNIYTPIWWKKVAGSGLSNDFELYLSKNLIPIPMDQRYTPNDIKELSVFIRGLL